MTTDPGILYGLDSPRYGVAQMKNITVRVDEATYHRARVRAVEAATPFSAMLREFLNAQVEDESTREAGRFKP